MSLRRMPHGAESSQPQGPAPFLVDIAVGLVKHAIQRGIPVRVSGSVACWLHCAAGRRLQLRNGRTIKDIDLVSYYRDKPRLDAMLRGLGYQTHLRVGPIPGLRRSVFSMPGGGCRVDVFYDALEFCHTIDLRGRLELDYPTISVTDLLMQKLQIVELTDKDVDDLKALMYDHDIECNGAETIDCDRIAELCSRDWGLCHTVTHNIETLRRSITNDEQIPKSEWATMDHRAKGILAAIRKRRKTIRWKLRAIGGERWRWYNTIEPLD